MANEGTTRSASYQKYVSEQVTERDSGIRQIVQWFLWFSPMTMKEFKSLIAYAVSARTDWTLAQVIKKLDFINEDIPK